MIDQFSRRDSRQELGLSNENTEKVSPAHRLRRLGSKLSARLCGEKKYDLIAGTRPSNTINQ